MGNLNETYDNSKDYAHGRLLNTVVRTNKGTPVRVLDIKGYEGSLVAVCQSVKNMFDRRVTSLDLTPVPLGYINSGGGAHYAVRNAVRNDWRQGLREQNFCCDTTPWGAVSFQDLSNTIKGVYPSLDTCKGMFTPYVDTYSVAFDREWAIDKGSGLHYQGNRVGVFTGHSEVDWGRGYSYLSRKFSKINKE